MILFDCKSEQKIDIEKIYQREGWAGKPKSPNKKPFDYYL
jgi:hypothetical protein